MKKLNFSFLILIAVLVLTGCSRYGVWEWGRLAVNYKVLFGVSPSEMLKHS